LILKKKIIVIKALFCNKKCRANFKKWKKIDERARGFALVSCSQNRCGFCGEKIPPKKTIVIV